MQTAFILMYSGLKILAAVGSGAYGVTQSLNTVDGDHREHIPSYTIFVNALGRSHHPPVRFEGFANDQYFIGCHVTSRFVASALPLS